MQPTLDDLTAAAALVRHPGEPPLTMFDAVLAVVRRLDVRVWTFGPRFEELGTTVWR